MNKMKAGSKLAQDKDSRLQKTDSFLHTEKSRKKWYKRENLGKQRKKPKQNVE